MAPIPTTFASVVVVVSCLALPSARGAALMGVFQAAPPIYRPQQQQLSQQQQQQLSQPSLQQLLLDPRGRRADEVMEPLAQMLPELGLAQGLQPQLQMASGFDKRSSQAQEAAVPADLKSSGSKRDAALLLDKIMFALKKAMDDKDKDKHGGSGGGSGSGSSGSHVPTGSGSSSSSSNPVGNNYDSGVVTPDNMVSFSGTGFERRGNSHGKVYWRCYFNAVSCF